MELIQESSVIDFIKRLRLAPPGLDGAWAGRRNLRLP